MKTLKEIRECAVTLQSSLCSYGTTEGDGKKCDCKFASNGKLGNKHSEDGCGCAEARAIIWFLDNNNK